MKIAIVLPDLRGGGAERMHVMLAREWISRGFEVDFVLLRARGELLEIAPAKAQLIDLEVERFRSALLPLCRYLKTSRPAVLLAAMWPLTVVAIIASRLSGTKVRTLVSDHNLPSLSYSEKGRIHLGLMRISMSLTYPMADERIAVSKGVATDLSSLSGIGIDRFRVIHNPAAVGVSASGSASLPAELAGIAGPLILSVGALKEVKNQALLIEAFSLLDERMGATLVILGEGGLRSDLEQLVIQRGLQGRVLLPGFSLDTTAWYGRADLFVLSSQHEGFGNVIVEALEQGVPVVSADCPSGPREILSDGKYGRLVPVGDASALAAAMRESLSESPDREALKARARDFSVARIADQYLDVLLPGWRGKGCR